MKSGRVLSARRAEQRHGWRHRCSSGSSVGAIHVVGAAGIRFRPWTAAAWASFAVAAGVSVHFAGAYQDDFRVYLMGAHDFFSPWLYARSAGGDFFTYPPFAALAFVPLELLGRPAAQAVFAAVNLAALVALIDVSIKAIRPDLAAPARRCWALGLTGPMLFLNPVILTMRHGQVNLILAAAVVWDLTASRPDRARGLPPGVATGLAAAVKLTPLIFIPYLMLTGRRRAASVCLATFACCEAAAFALSPVSSWRYWTGSVFDVTRVGGDLGSDRLLAPSDQSLTGVLARFAHAPVAPAVLWAAGALIGAAGLTIAVLTCRRWSPTLGVLLCAVTGLLVSPVTWAHHMVWVVPVIIWLAAAPERPRLGRPAAALTAVLFWCAPIWWVPGGVAALRQHLELHENLGQLLAGSSFFAWMVVILAAAGLLAFAARPAGAVHDRGGSVATIAPNQPRSWKHRLRLRPETQLGRAGNRSTGPARWHGGQGGWRNRTSGQNSRERRSRGPSSASGGGLSESWP